MLTLRDASPVSRSTAGRQALWSSGRWCDHFRSNQLALLRLPWEAGAGLTSAERDQIAPSLQVFQQGEAQEGRHFFRCARNHAESSGDLTYIEAHRLFMDEEKRHGRDLARFLTLAGVSILRKQSALARGFCWFGSRGGLEPTLLVILMSEVIALVYYAALRRATGSVLLRRLCGQILRDEKQHVRFQSERLAILRGDRAAPLLALTHALDRLLFFSALLLSWCCHRRVFRAGGFTFTRSWIAGWSAFRSVARQKDPRNYRAGSGRRRCR